MGAGESQPAAASVEAKSGPMDHDEVLHTLEKVVSNEYGKIQEELAASALAHADSVQAKTAVLKGKIDKPNPMRDAGCKAERDALIDCMKNNTTNVGDCKSFIDNFNRCAVNEVVR